MNVRKASEWTIQLVALSVGVVILFPVLFCFFCSFKTPTEVLTKPIRLLPSGLYADNYREVFRLTTIGRYMFNSLLVATICSAMRIVTSSLAAYSFAFFQYKGKQILFFFILGAMMIPTDATLVTNYLTVSRLGLVNTYLGVMCVYFVAPMNVFMMRQSFLTVSNSLRDSAYLDGCGNFRFYLQILLPISKPVLSTVFISSFVSMWNIYTWPMLVTNEGSMRTVQVAVTYMGSSESSSTNGQSMAAAMIVLIPAILVFLLFRNQIVRGVTAGALKE